MDKEILNKEFLNACESGNLPKILELLKNGADLEAKNKRGDTALMLTALNGHKEVAEFFIENGADLEAKNKLGDTALMYAAENGYEKVVELLIDNGADPLAQDKYYKIALDYAEENGHAGLTALIREKIETETETYENVEKLKSLRRRVEKIPLKNR
jgi:ankyrin repeat protein